MKNFNMKKILFILTLTFSFGNIFSQDTIIKRSSEIIVAKILEISPTEIKYKKFDFQDGPTYIEIKSKVQMIRYANGMKEIFEEEKVAKTEIRIAETTDDYVVKETPVSAQIDRWGENKFRYKGRTHNERDIHEVLLKTNDKKIMSLVGSAKDAKKAQYVGFAAIPLGVGAGALLFASAVYGTNNGYGLEPSYLAGAAVCAVAAIACPVFSISMKSKRNKCNRAAVKLYNEKY